MNTVVKLFIVRVTVHVIVQYKTRMVVDFVLPMHGIL